MAIRRGLVLSACVLPTAAGAAEPTAPPAGDIWQRLSLTWTHAVVLGGPGSSLETAMRDEGFDDTYLLCGEGWACDEEPWTYPDTTSSNDLYGSWAARVRFQLTPLLGVGASLCRSPLQETHGYRAGPEGDLGTFAFVSAHATTVAAVLSLGRGDTVWAGSGRP